VAWRGEYYACKVIRQSRGSAFPDINAQNEILGIISSGHHPNIVDVIDTWLERNSYFTTFYIQMELCEGDLNDFLQRRYSHGNQLSPNEIWDTFRQIMSGVEYIHLQDIVHGDLKPKNSITFSAIF
jgi:serine/threonine protein kinase